MGQAVAAKRSATELLQLEGKGANSPEVKRAVMDAAADCLPELRATAIAACVAETKKQPTVNGKRYCECVFDKVLAGKDKETAVKLLTNETPITDLAALGASCLGEE